jgi:flagellar hook-length control protein FliK
LADREVGGTISQVADRLEMLAAVRPKNGVTIRLEPEHLGVVTVRMLGSNRAVEAELSASNDSVRAALQSHRNELTSSLESRGIAVQALSVSSDAASSATDQQGGLLQQEESRPRTPTSFRQEAPTHPFTLDSARKSMRSASGVDLWI